MGASRETLDPCIELWNSKNFEPYQQSVGSQDMPGIFVLRGVRMGSSQVDRLIGGEKNLSHLDYNVADQVGRFIAPVGGIG